MTNSQYTLREKTQVSGIGLHSGQNVTATLLPTTPDSGITFQRTDLPGQPVIPALVSSVSDTHRGTTLSDEKGVNVRTVEHLLAALTGMGVWNCRVEIDSEELPILDGSSLPYVEQIREVGLSELHRPQEALVVDRELSFDCIESGSRYRILPASITSVSVSLEFPHLSALPPLGVSIADLPGSFEREVAPARTFCHTSELGYLISQGLAQGGSLDNAIVIYDGVESYPEVCRRLELDTIESGPDPEPGEPVAGFSFRLNQEPARHKVLDVLGDLALLGLPIVASIEAERPGHTGNTALARYLLSEFSDRIQDLQHHTR